MSPDISNTLFRLRHSLQQKGWSLRGAARELGVDHGHLHHVLHGKRESASLISRVRKLPRLQPNTSGS